MGVGVAVLLPLVVTVAPGGPTARAARLWARLWARPSGAGMAPFSPCLAPPPLPRLYYAPYCCRNLAQS